MLQSVYIKHEDYVFMRKTKRAKRPKYDIADSVLQRDVTTPDKYEIDINLTVIGVQSLVENLQAGMQRRFKSAMPSAEWRRYSLGDGVTYLLLENQQFNVTMCDDGQALKFRINIRTPAPNKQTYTFLQKWCEEMAHILLRNRKPLYTDSGYINSEEELDRALEETKPSCMTEKYANK